MTDPNQKEKGIVCPGCGAPFQQDDPESPGFTPPGLEINDRTICRRCFRMTHYRQFTKAPLSDDHVFRMAKREMGKADGAILFVDAFQPSINPLLGSLLEEWGKPILTVINKYDMLSGWFRSRRGKRRFAEILGAPSESLTTMNSLDFASVKKVTSQIVRKFNRNSRILLLGPVNSGKTTFLRSACQEAGLVSRSPIPGTTLGPIVACSSILGLTFVDIPGFRSEDPWIPILCPDCLISLQPGKKPNRLTTSLKPGDMLLFGGLVGVEVVECFRTERVGIAAFSPDGLILHRTRADRAEELLTRHLGGLFKVPCPGCRKTLEKYPTARTEYRLGKGLDLVLPGCGWLTTWQGEALFRVNAPDFFDPRTRPALIGGDDVHEC
jgi:hypothetical protein